LSKQHFKPICKNYINKILQQLFTLKEIHLQFSKLIRLYIFAFTSVYNIKLDALQFSDFVLTEPEYISFPKPWDKAAEEYA